MGLMAAKIIRNKTYALIIVVKIIIRPAPLFTKRFCVIHVAQLFHFAKGGDHYEGEHLGEEVRVLYTTSREEGVEVEGGVRLAVAAVDENAAPEHDETAGRGANVDGRVIGFLLLRRAAR